MTPMRTFQALLTAFVITLIASTTYAFAAENTTLPTTAGEGTSAVSGYEVTNISYSLNAGDPTRVDSVSFSLNANAGTVRIKLNDSGSTWYNCTALSGNDWACNAAGAALASIGQLRVVATSN
jgi:hypothetical protein